MPRSTRHCFTVTGAGSFPVDMLRYDCCWPYRGEDAARMEHHVRERRRIVLQTDSPLPPTAPRWESFNWRVVPGEPGEGQSAY